MKRILLGLILLVSLLFLISEIQYLESCCGGPPPVPPPVKPAEPVKPPTTTPPVPPPTPTPVPTPGPTPGLTPPSGGGGQPTLPPRSTPAGPSRPVLGIGLQPLFRSLRLGSSSLVGVVEPWEYWWSTHRDKFLSAKSQIEWAKITGDATTKSVTLYPIYEELLKVLTDGIADKNHYVAFRAAIALGKVPDWQNPSSYSQEAVNILIKADESESRYFVRNNILLALSLTGSPEAVKLIKETLLSKTEPPLRRSYAALSAGYIQNNPELIKILKEILHVEKEDNEVKSTACMALGNLKDASSVPILGKILNTEPSAKKEAPAVRAYAALGLGRIGGEDALKELKKFPLSEKEIDLRSAVVIALGMIGLPQAKDTIIPFLNDRSPITRGLAAISLAETQDKTAYEIISETLRKNRSAETEGLMVLALGLTGNDKAKADLRKILENKKSRDLLKGAAAIGLGMLKDKEALPAIISMLKDEKQYNNEILSPYLVLSLGMIGDPKGAEVLQKIWEKVDTKNDNLLPYHTDLGVALSLLGRKQDIVLPRILKQSSQTGEMLLRSYALHTLGLVGDRESAPAFVEASKDNNTYIRFVVMSGIGFLMDRNRINPLEKITADNIDIPMIVMNHILLIPVW